MHWFSNKTISEICIEKNYYDPTGSFERATLETRPLVHLPNIPNQKCSLLQGFLMACYVHGLGSQKMPDGNLHTLGNLHNQAN